MPKNSIDIARPRRAQMFWVVTATVPVFTPGATTLHVVIVSKMLEKRLGV